VALGVFVGVFVLVGVGVSVGVFVGVHGIAILSMMTLSIQTYPYGQGGIQV
jgi:hypothetical protein